MASLSNVKLMLTRQRLKKNKQPNGCMLTQSGFQHFHLHSYSGFGIKFFLFSFPADELTFLL